MSDEEKVQELVNYFKSAMADGKISLWEAVGLAKRVMAAGAELLAFVHELFKKEPELPSMGDESGK